MHAIHVIDVNTHLPSNHFLTFPDGSRPEGKSNAENAFAKALKTPQEQRVTQERKAKRAV
jgi:hypothetical protein